MTVYKWFRDETTVKHLASLIGADVTIVLVGDVETGEVEELGDGHGNKLRSPVTKKGVQVEVVGTLNLNQLAQLDKFLVGHGRANLG